ncbi:hypothetical protein D6D25_01228, partial [Aureobasidium pullulans]
SNEAHSFLSRQSPPSSLGLESPVEPCRRDSHCPAFLSSVSSEFHSSSSDSHGWIKSEDDERKPPLIKNVPEGKKRKFILVDDLVRGTRVRVHVELDNIKMEEMPDFHLQKNSVFPRQFFPRQMRSPSSSPRYPDGLVRAGEVEREDGSANFNDGDNMVHVPLMDGSRSGLSIPLGTKDLESKERELNELGYRMSWRQAKTFNERPIFMQKSLDAYRDKTWSAMLASGQNHSCLASHFEVRTGKRMWIERNGSDIPSS